MIKKHNRHRLTGTYTGFSKAVCESIHTCAQCAERNFSILMHAEDIVGRMCHSVFQQLAYCPLVSHGIAASNISLFGLPCAC